jgi:pyruvate dehydrogenase E2 component (dihydrolipoamide acetyltransferase)
MADFLMPTLGADMDAGTLVEWLVKPGSRVKHGDIIAVVETQKGAIEIEIFENGVFERPLIDVGAKVPVGTPMASVRYDSEGGAAGTAQAVVPATQAEVPSAAEIPAAAPAHVGPAPGALPAGPTPTAPPAAAPPPAGILTAGKARTRVTPAARRAAAEAGLDLTSITPSGPQGEIVLADLSQAATPAPAQQPPPTGGMRAAIAAAMSRSKREIPHYYLGHTIELGPAEAFVNAYNQDRAPADRLLLGAVFIKAVALAVRKHPEFNGFFVGGAHRPSEAVHVGMAINIRGTGLVAPAIHDAQTLEFDELMSAMRDLVVRVRAGRFRGSELADPTITVSSLGERGVETLLGVIYPPQVAIVGFGTPVVRPWVADGMVGPRRVVSLTLAGDHRVSDGHRGALFLAAIETLLNKPEEL